ncbi:LysE family transporter [Yunchengibacter salinarum]|uniref:LysE family transporter n=1 Tax=Yunchengibacter salinarum TaxID=3133399 RepID=UPI0035B67D91
MMTEQIQALPGLFGWGVLIGYVLSVPVGPVNILVLQRSLNDHAMRGFLIGMGAALGDGIYAVLAAFGLGAAKRFVLDHQITVTLIAALLLFGFAVRIWRARPNPAPPPGPVRGVKRSMLAAFFLTMGNPGVFVGFLTAYGVAGVVVLPFQAQGAAALGGALGLGVFFGAAAWWASLAWLGYRMKNHMTGRILGRFNRISAALIGVFAFFAMVSLAF